MTIKSFDNIPISLDIDGLDSSLKYSLIRGLGYLNVSTIGSLFSNVNDAPRNTIYVIDRAVVSQLTNLPEQSGGWLITIGSGTSTSLTSVAMQLYVTYEGVPAPTTIPNMYVRSRHGSSTSVWSSWSYLLNSADGLINYDSFDNSTKMKIVKALGIINSSTMSSMISDADEAERNSVYLVDANATASMENLPSQLAGYLITYGTGLNTSATSNALQLYATYVADGSTSPTIYVRARHGASTSVWSAWVKLIDTNEANSFLTSKGYLTSSLGISKLEDADPQSCYFVTDPTLFTDCPVQRQGMLLTFTQSVTNRIRLQTYTTYEPSSLAPNIPDIYYRVRYGSSVSQFSEWRKISVVSPNEGLASISMFKRIGVLGDSFASGSIYVNGTPLGQNYDLSWGQDLARAAGVEVVNYSNGGWAAYDFLHNTTERGLTGLLDDVNSDKACDLYVICFGINDSNPNHRMGNVYGGADYIGSSDDINDSDFTQNANSYWGCMGAVIQNIQTASPKSRIVVCTLAKENNATRKNYTQAVGQIAEYFGIPYVYVMGDRFFMSDYYQNGQDGSHPTAPLYSGMALAYRRLIETAMVDFYSYFKPYFGL